MKAPVKPIKICLCVNSIFRVIQLIFGKDYVVYCCVSLFHHLHNKIVEGNPDFLIQLLKCDPIEEFHFYQHLSMMEDLEKQYQHLIIRG